MNTDNYTQDELLALADRIGARIDAGRLPAKDANGMYVFTDADLFPGDDIAEDATAGSTCHEVRPGTLGYQMCWLPTGHAGAHKSQDFQTWHDAPTGA